MKMNDGQKKIVVSDTMLRVFLIVSVCILVVVGILYSNKMYVDFLNNVEPWIECFVGVLLVVVGGVYVNTKYVKSRKGGTKYYKFEYRKPELEKNLSAYCDKFSELKKCVLSSIFISGQVMKKLEIIIGIQFFIYKI